MCEKHPVQGGTGLTALSCLDARNTATLKDYSIIVAIPQFRVAQSGQEVILVACHVVPGVTCQVLSLAVASFRN